MWANKTLYSTKLPYRFRHGLVNAVDPGDGPEGLGDGMGHASNGDPAGGQDGPDDGGGYDGGLVDIGPPGPRSGLDENGKFTGVVDDSLGFVGRVSANMQTNVNRAVDAFSNSSVLGKVGVVAGALSSPGTVALGLVAMGVKSVSQALSTPGLTEADKAEIGKLGTAMDNMNDGDKASLLNDVAAAAGVNVEDIQTFTALDTALTTAGVADTNALSDVGRATISGLLNGSITMDEALSGTYGLTGVDKEAIESVKSTIGTMGADSLDTLKNSLPSNIDYAQEYNNLQANISEDDKIAERAETNTGTLSDSLDNLQNRLTENEATSQQNLDESGDNLWDTYVNEYFGEDDKAQEIIQDSGDWKSGDAQEGLDDLTGSSDKYNAIIDDLVSDYNTGTGTYSPFKFNVLGNDVSFVPKMNRALADQISGMAGEQYGVNQNLYDRRFDSLDARNPNQGALNAMAYTQDVASTDDDKAQDWAKLGQDHDISWQTLENALGIDSAKLINDANINYATLAENARTHNLNYDLGVQNTDINQQQVDQNESSTLDKIGETVNVLDGLVNLGKSSNSDSVKKLIDALGF